MGAKTEISWTDSTWIMTAIDRCDRELATIRAQQGQSGMNDGDRWGGDIGEADWIAERDLILLGVEIRDA